MWVATPLAIHLKHQDLFVRVWFFHSNLASYFHSSITEKLLKTFKKKLEKKMVSKLPPPSPPCPPIPSTFHLPAPVTGTPSATSHRAPAGPPSSPRALRARSSGAAAAPKRPEADAAGNADGHGPGAASLGAAGLPG